MYIQVIFVDLSQNVHSQVVRKHSLGEILGFIKTLVNLKKTTYKFNKTEINSRILSEHKGWKLETTKKIKARKFTNMWTLNHTLLNNLWIKEKLN